MSARFVKTAREESEIPENRDAQTHAILGAAIEVRRELRNGLPRPVYQDALAEEFTARGIPFERNKPIGVRYKGRVLPSAFPSDFLCFDAILVECLAQPAMGPQEEAKLLNLLRISGTPRGILLNFGASSLQYRRMALATDGAETPPQQNPVLPDQRIPRNNLRKTGTFIPPSKKPATQLATP